MRGLEIPAWNDVSGLPVDWPTTRPVTRPPAASSITASRAGDVRLRISWMKSLSFRSITRMLPASRPETVNEPSGPVTAPPRDSTPNTVRETPSTPLPPRTTRPAISLAGSITASTLAAADTVMLCPRTLFGA